MNYKTVNSSDGLTLTTTNGTPLVVGNHAYRAHQQPEFQRLQRRLCRRRRHHRRHLRAERSAATSQSRDQTLATMASQLDQYAYQFAQAVNNVQTAGSDVNGNPGVAIFDPPDTTRATPPARPFHRRRAHQRLADRRCRIRRSLRRQLQSHQHDRPSESVHHQWRHSRRRLFQSHFLHRQHHLPGQFGRHRHRQHPHSVAKPAELRRRSLDSTRSPPISCSTSAPTRRPPRSSPPSIP